MNSWKVNQIVVNCFRIRVWHKMDTLETLQYLLVPQKCNSTSEYKDQIVVRLLDQVINQECAHQTCHFLH